MLHVTPYPDFLNENRDTNAHVNAHTAMLITAELEEFTF